MLIGAAVAAAAIGGVPLFVVIAGAALVGLSLAGIDLAVAVVEFNRLGSIPTLTALPLFTFAGLLLAESRAPSRFLGLARALLGHLPGGIAIVAIVVSVGFTAFTGASGVTIIALGGLLLPALLSATRRRGPERADRLSVGLITAAGAPGLLVAPSLPVMVYAITAGVSIDRLFLAAALPAALLVVLLSAYTVRSIHAGTGAGVSAGASARRHRGRFSWVRLIRAVRLAGWELPLPIAVVAGIYAGAITVTEAATLTATYVFIVEVLVRREIHVRADLPRIIRQTGAMVGAILIVVGAALALTNVLVDGMVPQRLLSAAANFAADPLLFLLALNGVLLVAGMFVDVFSAIVVLVPLVAPVAATLGIDPLHLGVVFLVNLEVGYITPPVGINLFVARFRFRRSLTSIYRAALPFAVVMIIALLAITYIPALSLALPRLMAAPP